MAEEIEYGKQIIVIFEPFIWSLISDKLNRKTIETHIDNLWLLSGELIRLINQDQNNLDKEPLNLLLENIGNGEGPYCRHLQTENEIKSFDSTCRKLYKFLRIE